VPPIRHALLRRAGVDARGLRAFAIVARSSAPTGLTSFVLILWGLRLGAAPSTE